MIFFANELSFDGKFDDFDTYAKSLGCLMRMKNEAKSHGFNIQCTRAILDMDITDSLNFKQSLEMLNREQKQAVICWITQTGPFWDKCKSHSSDEYYELEASVVVTDTCLAEAAYHNIDGNPVSVISLMQPHWSSETLPVVWHKNDASSLRTNITNQTQLEGFVESLLRHPQPIDSWEQLEDRCRERFTSLSFPDTAFSSLKGVPFVQGASSRILELLCVLDKMKNCFNERGERTEKGHQLYRDHFTGEKGWFSDSSDTEKRNFRTELTFKHQKKSKKELFCPWHGKVKTPQIRIHHSWPIAKETPLYVMYVGPKITIK